ncbi:hypothetical protein [Arsenicibacter rosenii]|uniref:Uncharacterized protein n=1 Tax=Arsenicibacter rosenii TaxID=1750698 RepID=A0A1S2VIL2_9BACT|nr:hypothetical protein [Arsenicibacter rosenii]OIN58056.1 hypothetical protein BLX24_16130 [Arsenicibacter rosenii]
MQGTVIHYDPLTRCGVLQAEDGQVHYFRENQLTDAGQVIDNQRVRITGEGESMQIATRLSALSQTPAGSPPQAATTISNGKLSPADYDQLLQSAPAYPPSPAPVRVVERESGGIRNWPGTVAAALAFGLLLIAGNGMKPGRPERNIPLLTSWWAVGSAVLLIGMTYLQAIGGSLLRVRSAFWLVAICSGLAYLMQSCKGFETDTVTQWYFYTLVVLCLIIYILPYNRNRS